MTGAPQRSSYVRSHILSSGDMRSLLEPSAAKEGWVRSSGSADLCAHMCQRLLARDEEASPGIICQVQHIPVVDCVHKRR